MDTLPSKLPQNSLESQSGLAKSKPSSDLIPTLIENSIDSFIEIEQRITVQTILQSAVPISMQIKKHGRASIAQALDIQLIRLADIMNVKHNLKSDHIKIIVMDLLHKYPHETVEDFLLVFKRLRQGYYGQLYHLLNQATIMDCMNKHFEEKWTQHETNLLDQKQEDKKANTEKFAGIEAYAMALKKEGKLEEAIEIGKKLTEDAEYNEFRDNWLRKKIRDDKAKSTAKETESGRADEVSTGNE